jgi:hypothetical protein
MRLESAGRRPRAPVAMAPRPSPARRLSNAADSVELQGPRTLLRIRPDIFAFDPDLGLQLSQTKPEISGTVPHKSAQNDSERFRPDVGMFRRRSETSKLCDAGVCEIKAAGPSKFIGLGAFIRSGGRFRCVSTTSRNLSTVRPLSRANNIRGMGRTRAEKEIRGKTCNLTLVAVKPLGENDHFSFSCLLFGVGSWRKLAPGPVKRAKLDK